jgi:hypothetical protein
MVKKTIALIAITSLMLVTINLACSSSPATSPTTTNTGVSLKNNVQPIFSESCIFCHQGSNPPGGLSLEPAVVYNELVNATSTESSLVLVKPGAPDNSYLINKLNGTQVTVGGSGDQMPFGRQPLPQTQIDLISQWISEGAPNN